MTRQRSSFGLFGIFGRSEDLRQFDRALHSVDLHPRQVPEAVKLAAVNLLKDHAIGEDPAPQSYRAAAEILGYCLLGEEVFASANGDALARQVKGRIGAALEKTTGLDVQLILLALHAGVVQPSVVQEFGLAAEPGN